jgi:gamma-glutamyltranspeptidase / glutathione hydrolase
MTSNLDRYNSRRSIVYGTRGIVATSQPLAAQAGLTALQNGGNAFDAAVTTAATLNVVEPTSTGLGGDVFALYKTADGEVGSMRSCGPAPQDASIDQVRESITGENEDPASVEMPKTGAQTVTVPGTAKGWEKIIERFGERGLREALEPAILYATDGFPVSEVVSSEWQKGEELFEAQNARNAYLPNGSAPGPGQLVKLPLLGNSLSKVAKQGADVIYEGEIGDAIVDEVRSNGGVLSKADLESFELEWPEPISTSYNGVEVFQLPPNNQGLVVLEALNIAKELNVGDLSLNSAKRAHLLIEALKRAFVDGHYYITDPEYEDYPALESEEWAKRRANTIDDTAGSDIEIGIPNSPGEDADTVLLTVADKEGNVVSFINSRFSGFGSGLVAGDTGIALQNRGSSFSLNPEHPNSLEPGKRPFHTLIPALLQFGNDDWGAFGVMGGFMQPQGQLQIISNVVDCGLSMQAAIDQPRWRYRENGALVVEPHFDGSISAELVRKGHDVRIESPGAFGGAQMVRRNAEGVLAGATEPRKDGTVETY